MLNLLGKIFIKIQLCYFLYIKKKNYKADLLTYYFKKFLINNINDY